MNTRFCLVLMATLVYLMGAPWGCGSSEVSRDIGARCDNKDECEELCLTGDMYPNGLCTLSCTDNGDCLEQTHCVNRDQGGLCLFKCAEPSECEFLGENWTCSVVETESDGTEVKACVGR